LSAGNEDFITVDSPPNLNFVLPSLAKIEATLKYDKDRLRNNASIVVTNEPWKQTVERNAKWTTDSPFISREKLN
jgi:hypothetical protein